MSVVRRHLERAGAASAGLAPWAATGDPVRDLPDCFSGMLGTRIASASIDVSSSSGLSLEMAAEEAFSTALDRLGSSPVRVWAFLPSITGADQEGMNRYMRMNRGRGRAYRAKDLKWFPAGTGAITGCARPLVRCSREARGESKAGACLEVLRRVWTAVSTVLAGRCCGRHVPCGRHCCGRR